MILRGWQVLVDSFHVYAYHICDLLPGSAVLQHSAAPLHHFFSHHPTAAADSPFVQFSNNANVAHLSLGINDSAQQTWFLLFDPNNDSTQRIIAGSFSGTAAVTRLGYL